MTCRPTVTINHAPCRRPVHWSSRTAYGNHYGTLNRTKLRLRIRRVSFPVSHEVVGRVLYLVSVQCLHTILCGHHYYLLHFAERSDGTSAADVGVSCSCWALRGKSFTVSICILSVTMCAAIKKLKLRRLINVLLPAKWRNSSSETRCSGQIPLCLPYTMTRYPAS